MQSKEPDGRKNKSGAIEHPQNGGYSERGRRRAGEKKVRGRSFPEKTEEDRPHMLPMGVGDAGGHQNRSGEKQPEGELSPRLARIKETADDYWKKTRNRSRTTGRL